MYKNPLDTYFVISFSASSDSELQSLNFRLYFSNMRGQRRTIRRSAIFKLIDFYDI